MKMSIEPIITSFFLQRPKATAHHQNPHLLFSGSKNSETLANERPTKDSLFLNE